MKTNKETIVWVDEQKYYLAISVLGVFIVLILLGLSNKGIKPIELLIISAIFISLYLLFYNYLLPVKLFKNKIRVARYQKWIFFPRIDVYFQDIESIKIRHIDKTGHKEIGSARLSAGSGMIFVLIVKDKRGTEYLNIIFDRKSFLNKLKEVAPSICL